MTNGTGKTREAKKRRVGGFGTVWQKPIFWSRLHWHPAARRGQGEQSEHSKAMVGMQNVIRHCQAPDRMAQDEWDVQDVQDA